MTQMLKRTLVYLVRGITALLVMLFTMSAALLYTETGRVWLVETAMTTVASRLDYQLTWRGLHSPEANLWVIDELELHQDNSIDVNLSGIRLHCWPGTVFVGRLILDQINIDQATVNRLKTESGSATQTQNALPITVHSFSIGTLTLNPPVVAEVQRFSLSGDMELFNGDSLATVNTVLTPANEQWFKLSVAATVNPDMNGSASGWYDEQAQGPISNFLRLPPDEPFATSFQTEFDQTVSGFSLDIRNLAFAFHEHDVELRGRLQKIGEIYNIDTLRIGLDNSQHLLSGTINGNDLELQVALDDLPLDLAAVWAGWSPPGNANGQLNIRGTITAPTITADITAATHYQSLPLTVALMATATREQLQLQQVTITTTDGAAVTGAGSIDLADNTIDVQANLKKLSVQLLRQLAPAIPEQLTGNIDGSLGMNGPWRTPVLDFSGGFKGSYRDNVPIDLDLSANGKPYTAEQNATFQPSYEANINRFNLHIEDHDMSGDGHLLLATAPFTLQIDNTRIRLAGTVHNLNGNIKGDQLALNLNLNGFPLDIISPLIGKPLSGAASAKVFIGGTFSEPLLTGTMNSNLVYQTVPLKLQTGFDASRKWIEFRQLKISNDQTDISAEGMLDLINDENDLVVNVNDIDTATLTRLGLPIPDKLNGRIRSDLTVKGSRQLPIVTGEAHFAGTWQDTTVAILMTGGGNKERFSIDEMELNAGEDGYLLLQGNYKNQMADFRLEAHDLPSKLLQTGSWEPPEGVLAVNLTLQGTRDQPRAGGKLVFSPIEATGETAAPQSGLEADVTLGDNRLEARLTLVGDSARTGKINLSIPWRRYLQTDTSQAPGQFPLFGSLQAQASLEEICRLLLDSDIHQCRGALQADLTLGGTSSLPELNGSLTVSDGFYENLQSGTNVHDLQVDIQANGRQLQIVKATATDGEQGVLELSGKGGWRRDIHDDDINLLLKVNNSHILRRYDMDGIANGVLTLTGNHQELFLSGTLMFQPFTLAMQSLMQEEIPTLVISGDDEQQKRVAASTKKWQMLPSIHMDVVLTADQQAFLRGPGLEAELQGKLLIQGTYPEPVFRGNFKTVRGSVRILGKRFILNDGELRLEGDVFSMLIPATYTGKDMEVRAELSGTLDDLNLALTSTPSYPEDEIISQLLFGKSSQNVTPLQAIRLANAINTFRRGGRPLFDPLGKLEKALSIDRLTVEDNGNSNGVLLGVGKYINERVYVELETGTGAGEAWQGNVEVELLPNLNLENTINSESGFGSMGINWKKDY